MNAFIIGLRLDGALVRRITRAAQMRRLNKREKIWLLTL